jgi:cellulose biosynthesis protein BcsQ
MKLITCSSFKGGAGKTTALMGICSSLISKGKRIALFEADENRPLTRWRENALSSKTWDENCQVFVADELAALESSYEAAQQAGYDYALADTHGGSSELNNTIVASSDFLLLPSMLTPLDIDETLATYRYVVELMVIEKLEIPTAILKQRVPVGRLTLSQTAASELLNELPLFDHPMHERDAFAAMKQRGMLHRTTALLADNPSMRLQIRAHQTAMDEAHGLSSFIENTLSH